MSLRVKCPPQQRQCHVSRSADLCCCLTPLPRIPLSAASDGPSDSTAKGLTGAPQPPLALGSEAAERSTAGSAASLAAALLMAWPVATAGPRERDAER